MRTIPATRQAPDSRSVRRGSPIFLTQIAKSSARALTNRRYQTEGKATYKIYTCKMKNGVCVKNPPGDASKVEHIAVLRGARFSVPRRHSCRRFSGLSIPPSAETLSRLTTVKTTREPSTTTQELVASANLSGTVNFLGASCKNLGQDAKKRPLSTRIDNRLQDLHL
jgi:hypothetical protein